MLQFRNVIKNKEIQIRSDTYYRFWNQNRSGQVHLDILNCTITEGQCLTYCLKSVCCLDSIVVFLVLISDTELFGIQNLRQFVLLHFLNDCGFVGPSPDNPFLPLPGKMLWRPHVLQGMLQHEFIKLTWRYYFKWVRCWLIPQVFVKSIDFILSLCLEL